jgi:hypothetical protein
VIVLYFELLFEFQAQFMAVIEVIYKAANRSVTGRGVFFSIRRTEAESIFDPRAAAATDTFAILM